MKVRIKELSVGRLTVYIAQVQKRFLFWNYWAGFWAGKLGKFHYTEERCTSKEKAMKNIHNLSDIMDEDYELVEE